MMCACPNSRLSGRGWPPPRPLARPRRAGRATCVGVPQPPCPTVSPGRDVDPDPRVAQLLREIDLRTFPGALGAVWEPDRSQGDPRDQWREGRVGGESAMERWVASRGTPGARRSPGGQGPPRGASPTAPLGPCRSRACPVDYVMRGGVRNPDDPEEAAGAPGAGGWGAEGPRVRAIRAWPSADRRGRPDRCSEGQRAGAKRPLPEPSD
jgi:hypothetical protein